MMMNKMKVKGILLQLKKINQGLGLLGKMIVNQNNWPSPVPVRRENPRKIKKYSYPPQKVEIKAKHRVRIINLPLANN
jgi:hypothetical protein